MPTLKCLLTALLLGLASCGGEPLPEEILEPEQGQTPAPEPPSAKADRWQQSNDACTPTWPRTSPTTVSALPDAGEAPFLEVLDSAKHELRVMIYLMGYGGILDTLIAKARAGVKVRVLIDKGQADVNAKYASQLAAAGAEVQWSDPKFPYMHAKLIVVDSREALITTGNFSKSYSILLERNFVARLTDPADVQDLASLFEADWDRRAPQLGCTRLLVSPINARERLLGLIDSATSSLTIESMQLGDKDVRARVAARKAAGVEVRAILADASWIGANADAAAFLAAQGIPARSIPHCHVKAIVADGARAFVGSENLSYTSLSKNREVGVILTEESAVEVMSGTFEKDWSAGKPF